jgi:uncharacterized protein (TIGR02996 family)
MTEDDWKAAVMAQPEDQTIWHAIADWLEERDQPLRAELVRLSRIRVGENPQRVIELLDAGVEPVIPVFRNMMGMQFAYVQAGTFLMGSPESEHGRFNDEIQHEVRLTKPFYLGVYPVTVGEFQQFVSETGHRTEAEVEQDDTTWATPRFAQDASLPVEGVSWEDAQAMVRWLNQIEANSTLACALPTEAQWEYACRAGNQAAFHWGDDKSRFGEFAWSSDNAQGRTWPAQTKRANVWGLWHMHGMIWEWCEDRYGDYPESAVTNPKGVLTQGSNRVVRGGSRLLGPRSCRSANRGNLGPLSRSASIGLRLQVSVQGVSEGS